MNKEKALLIGVLNRFYNLFDWRDVEIYDHNLKQYDTIKEHFKAIKKMDKSELKREVDFQTMSINTRRRTSKKERETSDYINFIIN